MKDPDKWGSYMKKIIVGLVFSLIFAGSAFAELIEVDGKITAEIPSGDWLGSVNNNGNLSISETNLSGALMVIFINPNEEGLSLQQAAEAALTQRNGRDLQQAGDNGYAFLAQAFNYCEQALKFIRC